MEKIPSPFYLIIRCEQRFSVVESMFTWIRELVAALSDQYYIKDEIVIYTMEGQPTTGRANYATRSHPENYEATL